MGAMGLEGEAGGRAPRFPETRWSIVLRAGDGAAPASRKALAELSRAYWYPVYAFIRRTGRSAEDSCDLTQGFFTRLLAKNDLAAADPGRGRFRSFLLASVKHYLANAWDRERAEKRGGGEALLSIDAADAEGRYRVEPAHDLTPERIFERRWALIVLERTLSALADEYARRGKGALFERLEGSLLGQDDDVRQRALAAELGLTPGALRVALHRMRERYHRLLEAEIVHTVEGVAEVEAELADLRASLRPS
jgi:RNA polymerase sigma-70 factor (ECF subfamily)